MCVHQRASKDMAMAKEQQDNSAISLPDDLIERIMAFLPLKAKLSCRCVCKSWNSILSSDNLLLYTTNTKHRSSGYGNACLMLTTKGPFAYMLDPPSNLWHQLPQPMYPGASILAAAHGLVCIGNQVSECRSLSIYNLLSNTWKPLPNMLHVGLLHKVTMAMDPYTHAYVVVATGEDTSDFRGRRRYRLRTEVYDSILGSWRMAGDALSDAFGSYPGVWCDGLFYCITELPYGLLPYGLTVFNLAKGEWGELAVEMPTGIAVPALVSCKGQLMMVGIQKESRNVFDGSVSLRVSRSPLQVSLRTRLRMSRSWSWSGPLQMWALSQLRSTIAALPSIVAWTSSASSRSSSLPSSPSLLSLSTTPLSMSPTQSPLSSPLSPSPSTQKASIKVWTLVQGKQWKLVDQIPEDMCAEFMAHLPPKTALVSVGVGEEVCVTSHQSPNAVIFDAGSRRWRYAARDPLFPRDRDAHMWGFSLEPDRTCVP